MTTSNNCAITNGNKVTDAEKKLLDVIHRLEWGKLEVSVKNGQPVMASQIREDIKLT